MEGWRLGGDGRMEVGGNGWMEVGGNGQVEVGGKWTDGGEGKWTDGWGGGKGGRESCRFIFLVIKYVSINSIPHTYLTRE